MFLQFGWRKTKKGPHLICVNILPFFFFSNDPPPNLFYFFQSHSLGIPYLYYYYYHIYYNLSLQPLRERVRERALLESCPLFALLTKLVWTFRSISWKDIWRQEDWFPLIPPFLQDTFLFTNAVAHIQTHTHTYISDWPGLSIIVDDIWQQCFNTNKQQRTSITRDLLFLLWHQLRRITVLISGMLCILVRMSDMVICDGYLYLGSSTEFALVCLWFGRGR